MAELQKDKIERLLEEFAEHRQAIKVMIEDLDKIREKIDTILPESLDKRFKFFFEEKVKTITSFYSSLLEMRKEITKSIKDEVELRRKIQFKDREINLEDVIDISKYADKITQMQKKRKEMIERDETLTTLDEIRELEIEIPSGETEEKKAEVK
jgi:hypothetical protein